MSDSSFPLAFDDLEPDGIYLMDEFQGDAQGFTILVSTGEAHATGEVSQPTAEQ